MKILITNDDGFQSELLKILAASALPYGEVCCVAPAFEQSGMGHAISVFAQIKIKKEKDIVPGIPSYTIDGTPADCVRVCKRRLAYDFDLVLSGINNGYNVGRDIFYSGTIGAATEGVLDHKKGIAVSLARDAVIGVKEIREVLDFVFQNKLLDLNPLWNINIPAFFQGFRFTKLGTVGYWSYRWDADNEEQTDGDLDLQAVEHGRVSITPLLMERSAERVLEALKKKTEV